MQDDKKYHLLIVVKQTGLAYIDIKFVVNGLYFF